MAAKRNAVERELDEAQRAEADRLIEEFGPLFEAKKRELAELFASKKDHELLGKTEFELRDAVHELGAGALEQAVNGRAKKGGTPAPACHASSAGATSSSSAGNPSRSSR